MTEIERVLIAIDDDSATEVALDTGMAVAQAQGAEVLVLAILQNLDHWVTPLSDILSADEIRSRYAAQRRTQLERLVVSRETSRPVRIEVTAGIPFVEVIRRALGWGANLIVQASHPLGSSGAFTSADWHLIRKSPVPVWIAKPGGYPPRHVAAAVELGSTEPDADDFNRRIIGLAAAVADRAGAQLSVFSAWYLPGEATLRASPMLRVSRDRLEGALAQARGDAARRQRELADWQAKQATLPPDRLTWHLQNGQPREAIPVYVAEHGVDLLVMGTVGRTGIPGMLIGNTAETVLSRIQCSALTLKPAPFVTPVT